MKRSKKPAKKVETWDLVTEHPKKLQRLYVFTKKKHLTKTPFQQTNKKKNKRNKSKKNKTKAKKKHKSQPIKHPVVFSSKFSPVVQLGLVKSHFLRLFDGHNRLGGTFLGLGKQLDDSIGAGWIMLGSVF